MNVRTINLKLGNMRKAESFVVYPNATDTANVQSSHRFAKIDLTSGEGRLGKYQANHSSSIDLVLPGSMDIKVDQATIDLIKGATPKSGDTVANGICVIA